MVEDTGRDVVMLGLADVRVLDVGEVHGELEIAVMTIDGSVTAAPHPPDRGLGVPVEVQRLGLTAGRDGRWQIYRA